MDTIEGIPLEYRLAGLFVLGAAVASIMNLAIYRLAWNQRSISPWSPPPVGGQRRIWLDRVPIFGWLSLRREFAAHGRGFWIRPLLVELATGLGLAALYWWEVDQPALFTHATREPLEGLTFGVPLAAGLRHAISLSHAILILLMIVASVIDFDEKTIPDGITVPGTLVGLVLAATLPWSLLPVTFISLAGTPIVEFLHIASPNSWPAPILGNVSTGSLLIGLGCYAFWCFLLLPRAWYGRYGFNKARQYFIAKIVREPGSQIVLVMWIVGTIGITSMWVANATHWAALLTSLVGMATGGGIIWTVRLIGYAVLRKEAMGFGDVTLMSMIGAFVGWQAAILIFFLAPIVGLVFGVINLLLKSETEIPYGPFLCAATLAIIVRWADVWRVAGFYFELGVWIPVLLGLCLVLMIVLLMALQLIKRAFSRG